MSKVALVTGGASELGRAVCHCLRAAVDERGEAAYRVFVTDLRVDDMADLEHDGFETLHMDVTSDLSVSNAVENVLEMAGRIDALVCDAGVMTAGAIIDQRIDAAQRALDINVLGFLRVVQAIVPVMMKQKGGLIVAAGSLSAYLTVPFGGMYSASKACLHSMAEALRMEVAPWSIDVMLVEWGVFDGMMAANTVHRFPPLGNTRPAYEHAVAGKQWDEMLYIHSSDSRGNLQRATSKIVGAMQKKKPPRKILVGSKSRKLKFMGFVQVWLSPGYVSRKLSRVCGLNKIVEKFKQGSVSAQI